MTTTTKRIRLTKKALRALKASIAHWKRLATGKRLADETIFISSCALCSAFYDHGSCTGCPIKKRTGRAGCEGTPWIRTRNAVNNYTYNSDEFRSAAKKQLEFLQSFLPKTK